jgi:hypothetical protein
MVVDSLEGLLPTGDDTILPVCRRKKIRERCGALDHLVGGLGLLTSAELSGRLETLKNENGLGARDEKQHVPLDG